jgi:dTDP-4-amino-4,6-dideoxygalactose transaminase
VIPFLDLAGDFAAVEADARARIDGVLSRQQFVLGPETAELEAALQQHLGVASAVAVSSGTEALSLSLLALGIGPGDAVVMPAFTFFASAGAVVRAGALPVFCDLDRWSFLSGAQQMRATINREFRCEAGRYLHRASGARLAALLPVHLYGRACNMSAIVDLARETGAKVIEDAAQAIGARVDGKSVGRFGDSGCFSFYPTKNLGGPGDGGLVVCADPVLAARLARLRSHGGEHGSYEHLEVGINARMSEFVAAVLNAKLALVEEWTARRRLIAARYRSELADAAARGVLELPSRCDDESHVWHQFAIRIAGVSRRDRVKQALEEQGIASRVFYPLPLHLQPCFAGLGGRQGDLPDAEAAAREVLCLPIYPSLDDSSVSKVAAAVIGACAR